MASTRALWVGIIVVASLLTFFAGRWAMAIWLSNEQYRIENNVLQFAGNTPQHDDMTMLAINIK